MELEGVHETIGSEGIAQLVAAFYRRVATDDILGPMYPREDMAGAEQRLRDFLIFRFGGPADYLAQRGHPQLGRRHMPFAIDEAARDRWTQLMDEALAEFQLPADAVAAMQWFFHGTATFLINRR